MQDKMVLVFNFVDKSVNDRRVNPKALIGISWLSVARKWLLLIDPQHVEWGKF